MIILGIIASIFIGLIIIHYIYTNWKKFREIHGAWANNRIMPTVNAVEVDHIPINTVVIEVNEEIHG